MAPTFTAAAVQPSPAVTAVAKQPSPALAAAAEQPSRAAETAVPSRRPRGGKGGCADRPSRVKREREVSEVK